MKRGVNVFDRGGLYKIRFYDHCIGSPDKIICEVAGWVLSEDDDHVLLSYWIVDHKDEQIKADNVEYVSIIKSCIIRKKRLR